MSLDLDEAQEWRTRANRISEKGKILHEELVASGLHQDVCYLVTRQWLADELRSKETAGIDTRNMNKVIEAILKQFPKDDD